eukprot:1148411-Pelagomonas_calceolata.AAC.6
MSTSCMSLPWVQVPDMYARNMAGSKSLHPSSGFQAACPACSMPHSVILGPVPQLPQGPHRLIETAQEVPMKVHPPHAWPATAQHGRPTTRAGLLPCVAHAGPANSWGTELLLGLHFPPTPFTICSVCACAHSVWLPS